MSQRRDAEKPAITIEEAMQRTLHRYDGVFKALAELEARERDALKSDNQMLETKPLTKDEQA